MLASNVDAWILLIFSRSLNIDMRRHCFSRHIFASPANPSTTSLLCMISKPDSGTSGLASFVSSKDLHLSSRSLDIDMQTWAVHVLLPIPLTTIARQLGISARLV